MKKLILFSLLTFLISLASFAQTSVAIKINHKSNGNQFAFHQQMTNNLDENFTPDRLEYYLSQFKITYDNGQTVSFPDLYTLVNITDSEPINLGDLNVITIESLSFRIGVDAENNHGDPSLWNPSHPLAPKFPSMHWGWAAGYRFLAIEGKDADSNQDVQIHALGDDNYFEVVIPVNMELNGNDAIINIDANYEKIFENISFSGGLIYHGETGPCITALENMRDLVFTASNGTVSVPELGIDFFLSAFPNPAVGGNVTIDFDSDKAYNFDITVIDILGKKVATRTNVGNTANINLELPSAGLYLLNLSLNGETIHTQKIIAQ